MRCCVLLRVALATAEMSGEASARRDVALVVAERDRYHAADAQQGIMVWRQRAPPW